MPILMAAAVSLALAGGAQAAPALSETALRREADLRRADSALLRRAARAQDGRLRREALRAMGNIQSPSYEGDLVAALSSGEPRTRVEAVFDLGQLALLEPAGPDEAETRRLSELRGRAAAALAPLLRAGPAELRCAAAEALGKAGGSAAEPLLVEALRGEESCLRQEAALALFRLRYLKRIPEYSSSAVAGLAAAARAPEAELRWRAVYAFSRWPEPRAAEALSAAARDEDARARLFALRALGQLNAAAPAEALSAAANDPDAMVRREAVAALAAAGRADLLDEAVWRDPSAHVRAAAAGALAGGAGDKLAGRLEPLLADPSPMVRGAAVLAVPKLARDAAASLARQKDSPDWWVKSRAYLAMAEVPGSRADLLQGLADPDPRAASAALEALGKSTEAFVVPILERVLRDPKSSLELRGTAADAAAERAGFPLEALDAAWRNSQGREWSEVRDSIKRAAQVATSRPGYSGGPYVFLEPKAEVSPSPFLREKPPPASVVLQTTQGDIEIALEVDEAPVRSEER
ncbi:MAG: HEAT repeat domain-containing protein, partial [Elusimicrobia bacterium]|nr:HEAT repeat domain-containing protein [Elusimicrobiota bacterium]